MDQLIFTNNGTSLIQVADLGIEVNVGEDFDLLQSFTAEDIIESNDFPEVFNQGAQITLVTSTETYVMSQQDVIDYLTPLSRWTTLDYSYISNKDSTTDVTGAELESLTDGSDTILHNHDNRYYTETELQTPGGAQVHWDNIIGSSIGNTRIVSGDLYFQDETRQNKWLSAAEQQYVWSEHNVDGKYMSVGNLTPSTTGYLLPQDFTITKISVVTSSGEAAKELEIRLNNSSTFTFNLSSGQYISTTLNIDAYLGDVLGMFVSGAGGSIKGVVATLFGKWRTI